MPAAALMLVGAAGFCRQSPEPDADQLLERAQEAYLREGARSALPQVEKALRLYREEGDLRGEAKAESHLGNCRLRLADYPGAMASFERALAMQQALGDRLEAAKVLNNLGLVDWKTARYDQARRRFQQSLEIARKAGDEKIRGAALGNLGLVFDESGDHARSLELYEQALAAFRKAGFQKGIADTLGNLGGRSLLMGEYEEALGYFLQARQADRQAGLAYEESVDEGNIGLCRLGLGKLDQALSSFEQALQLSLRVGALQEEADWRRAKGKALQWAGSYEPALAEFRAAFEIYSQTRLPPQTTAALREMGATCLLLGDLSSSERHFRQALQIAQQAGLKGGSFSSAMALGDLDWQKGDFGHALGWYEQACQEPPRKTAEAICRMRSALVQARLGRPGQARQSALQAFELAQGLGPRMSARTQVVQGQVEQISGRIGQALRHYDSARALSLRLQDKESAWRIAYYRGQCLQRQGALEEAAQAFAESIGLLEALRRRLVQERFYAGYIDSRAQPYLSLVPLLVEMGEHEQALYFADRLRGGASTEFQGVPSQAIRELMRVEREGRPEEDPLPVLDEASAVPSFESRRRQAKRLIAGWGAQLGTDSALIEYVVAEQGLIAFVLTSNGLHASIVPVSPQSLTSRVDLLRGLLARPQSQDWRGPAAGLWRLLIEPLLQRGRLDGIRHLVVVPHSILHYLPFSVLLGSQGGRSRLLVEDYTISYLPSLQSLSERIDRDGVAGRGILAVLSQQDRLPQAAAEIQEIQRIFGGESHVLAGAQASESAFKSQAGRYRVIHLVTHSEFDKGNPLRSSLMLAPGGSDDGRLEAREIAQLRLHADLVVLSACETALGAGYFTPLPPGDDFVSLTRAFLQAGSRSVLASLWRIDDQAGARLAGEFYRGRRQLGSAAALARAQRRMLSSDYFSHPYYWAAFVLVGDR